MGVTSPAVTAALRPAFALVREVVITLQVYATSDELAAWLNTAAPVNAAALLRSASLLVARACNLDPYAGSPIPGNDVQPLADATCAQAAAWTVMGVDPATAGLEWAPVKSTKLGDAEQTFDTTSQVQAFQSVTAGLAPETEAILQAAGLLALPLPVFTDPSDRLKHYGLPDRRWFYGGEPLLPETVELP